MIENLKDIELKVAAIVTSWSDDEPLKQKTTLIASSVNESGK